MEDLRIVFEAEFSERFRTYQAFHFGDPNRPFPLSTFPMLDRGGAQLCPAGHLGIASLSRTALEIVSDNLFFLADSIAPFRK